MVNLYHNFSACDCLISAKAENKASRVPPLPHTHFVFPPTNNWFRLSGTYRPHKVRSVRDQASTESPDPFRPYSSNLPRLRLDGATRLNWPSADPTLFSGVSLNRTPALSPNVSWPSASPARQVFSAPRFQSKSLTNTSDHRTSVIGLAHVPHDAPSAGAITGLSCTAILAACAPRYRVFQISPQTPDVFPRPQQPTCVAHVRQSPAAPGSD